MIVRPARTVALIAALVAATCAGPLLAKPHAKGHAAMGHSMAMPYAAALADPTRPAADRERDAARLPGELLTFANIRPGQQVGDFVMGGGYLTRILAAAVGPNGRVYAFQPEEFMKFKASYADDQKALVGQYKNVNAVNGLFAAPAFPVALDTIVTVQNFHDLYLKPFAADNGERASKALFAALKSGGTLVVVDHSAKPGTGTTMADTLHRIDKAAVIAALTKAGFKLEAESQLYARPADPRTVGVFDPSIRGKTDQFALRFRKPK